MKRNIIESLIFGYLATYLPVITEQLSMFERVVGAQAIGILIFGLYLKIEERRERNERKEFVNYFAWIRREAEIYRQKGADDNAIRCMFIGMITAYAGEEKERTFTESQLKKIFDLSFTKK